MENELEEVNILFKLLKGANLLKNLKDNLKKKRSCGIRKINRTRNQVGYFKVTFSKIKKYDQSQFFIHTRMTQEIFNMLHQLIQHQMTETARHLLSSEFCLGLTLLYLSQGCTFQSLSWSWKVGKETVRTIVYETCDILWQVLGPLYVSEPNLQDLKLIADEFHNSWNLPNCIGAIDGKHIAIQCPPNSGSEFFNYKKFFSIVLMAACDARYVFTYIDVGVYGSQSNGGIFNKSKFGKRVCSGQLPFPEPKPLPGTNNLVPHFFAADAAFTLTPNLIKPYPGLGLPKNKENFNKRLSRARRVIENAFGILISRWRILLTTLNMMPDNAEKIILACVALHNFLRLHKNAKNVYAPSNFTDWEDSNHTIQEGLWRSETNNSLPSIQPSRSLHVLGGNNAIRIRDTLCSYVNNEGRLQTNVLSHFFSHNIHVYLKKIK